jgi:FkbM family methyltransferase
VEEQYKQMYKLKSILKSLIPPRILKFIRYIKKKIFVRINSQFISFHCSKKWYGNKYGGFYICPDVLPSLSRKIVIYSCGIGEDISFDIALMNTYNCEIFAFDPTPKSIEWIEKQNLPSNFVFSPYGISEKTETQLLHLSNTPLDISASIYVHGDTSAEDCIIVQMKSLEVIATEHHHTYVDILKMDIEGSEFAVIKNLPKSVIFGQIVVEFHERFLKDGSKVLKEALTGLKKNGYYCFAISDRGDEYSFINKSKYSKIVKRRTP